MRDRDLERRERHFTGGSYLFISSIGQKDRAESTKQWFRAVNTVMELGDKRR